MRRLSMMTHAVSAKRRESCCAVTAVLPPSIWHAWASRLPLKETGSALFVLMGEEFEWSVCHLFTDSLQVSAMMCDMLLCVRKAIESGDCEPR